jgi:hypothetical protein
MGQMEQKVCDAGRFRIFRSVEKACQVTGKFGTDSLKLGYRNKKRIENFRSHAEDFPAAVGIVWLTTSHTRPITRQQI